MFVTIGELMGWRQGSIGSDEALLVSAASAACETVEALIGRHVAADDYVEKYSGSTNCSGFTAITLDEFPVVSITSVKENGVTLAGGSDYLVDKPTGTIFRTIPGWPMQLKHWAPGFANVEVSYRAGWEEAAVPAALKQYAIELAWLLYDEGKRSGVSSLARGVSNSTLSKSVSEAARLAVQTYVAHFRPMRAIRTA